MLSLYKYIKESLINEGGAAGHMAHPIDYSEFTRDDLKELITNLFSGEIEDITEKIDGTNIQATMNSTGEVVFIRNKGDLNSAKGGMSITDMSVKWMDKPSVAQTFISAGKTITEVFNKIGKEFFNPDENTKKTVNCECVIAGVTNIIPYATAQVDFHNIWTYEKGIGNTWRNTKISKQGLDVINKACEGMDAAKITPKVIINVTKESDKLVDKYTHEIDKLFDSNITIEDWKYNRFTEYINNKYKWIADSPDYEKVLYDRWFNNIKSTNIRLLKKAYPEHTEELVELDKKGYKDIVNWCIEPLDILFLKIGNSVIKLCNGFINQGTTDKVIQQLANEVEKVTKDIQKEGSPELQEKLLHQLNRLEQLNNDINPAEGIVFNYRGKMMKLTGSFAPLNQILGSIKFSR